MLKPESVLALCFGVSLMQLSPISVFAEPTYRTGTLLHIEKKVRITPMTYVFNVVATYYETVTYELQIQVGQEVYFTAYTPDIQPNWPLPGEWKANQPLDLRTEKNRLFIKLSYDGELLTYISRRTRLKSH